MERSKYIKKEDEKGRQADAEKRLLPAVDAGVLASTDVSPITLVRKENAPIFPDSRLLPDRGMRKLRKELVLFREILHGEEVRQAESELPAVIGEVSDKEWEFLSHFTFKDNMLHTDGLGFNFLHQGWRSLDRTREEEIFHAGISDLVSIIKEDLKAFDEDVKIESISIDRKYTEAGQTQRPFSAEWHSDEDPYPRYIVSGDFSTTQYYTGNFTMDGRPMPTYEGFMLDSIDSAVKPISAPARTIVRHGPFTVHRTPPKFTESGRRMFISVRTCK